MKFYFQNEEGDTLFAMTPAQWEAALARAGESGHEARFGLTDEDFAAGMQWAEVLVAQSSALYGRFPCASPNLKLMFTTSAGMDKLMPYENLPRVPIANNSGTHSAKAAEYGLMALLMLNARLPDMLANQRAGLWKTVHAPSLRGRRVTVIGTGDLGAPVARAARLFGAVATGVRTKAEPHPDFDRVLAVDALDSVLPETDFLVIACPLTPATRGLLDRRRLSLLPQGAGIVNIGRGPVIEQAALCDLLESDHLGGAVLDVFEKEPIPPGDRIWTTRNVVISPHVSVDDPLTYNPDSLDILFANLKLFRAGQKMTHQVDLGRGY